jgi:hypothetical protein
VQQLHRAAESGSVTLRGACQTSYTAELRALMEVIVTNADESCRRKLWIYIDNKSVYRGAKRIQQDLLDPSERCWLPPYNCTDWFVMRQKLSQQPDVIFEWVPSHGKKIGQWSTSSPLGVLGVRALNKAADEAATDATNDQYDRYKFKETEELEKASAKQMIAAMQRIVLGQLHAVDTIPNFLDQQTMQMRTFW